MLDLLSKNAGDVATKALMDQLRTLYRARPFTKSVPFNQVLGADPFALWEPVNAYFEVGKIIIRADIAGTDLSICDTTVGQPFAFAMPPTTIYQEIDFDPGYRSLNYAQARLLIFDPAATGVTVKGVILGWEVTPQGYYR